jgi:hypothetical protein
MREGVLKNHQVSLYLLVPDILLDLVELEGVEKFRQRFQCFQAPDHISKVFSVHHISTYLPLRRRIVRTPPQRLGPSFLTSVFSVSGLARSVPHIFGQEPKQVITADLGAQATAGHTCWG